MLYAVSQGCIELLSLCLELISKTLLQSAKIGILLLKTCLHRLCLLLSVLIALYILLELCRSCLQRLSFCIDCVLDILALLLQNQRIFLTELIL